jgi:hypothetical protein
MMARACVFRDIEVWMRMDPGRGAGDVAQIRSKLRRSRERDGQGTRAQFTHQPTHTAYTEITSGATPAAQHARP